MKPSFAFLRRASAALAVAVSSFALASSAFAGWAHLPTCVDGTYNNNSIAFSAIHPDKGVLVAGHGQICYTLDAGKTWALVSNADTSNLRSVTFQPGTDVAWAVGDTGVVFAVVLSGTPSLINYTSNAWQANMGHLNLYAVAVVPKPGGYNVVAMGDQGILIYGNQFGTGWTAATIVDPPAQMPTLRAVSFAGTASDMPTGYAVGNAFTIIKSTNYGATWTIISADLSQTQDLYGVNFPFATNGYVVGNNAAIWYTSNGGMTWNNSCKDASCPLFGSTTRVTSASLIYASNAIFHSYFSALDGHVYEPTGFGWVTHDLPISQPLNAIFAVNSLSSTALFAAGNANYYAKWDETLPPPPENLSITGNATANGGVVYTREPKPSFGWSYTDDAQSGTSGFYGRIVNMVNNVETIVDENVSLKTGSWDRSMTSALPDGPYTFKVEAIDYANNHSDVSTLDFVVDTTAPTVGTPTMPATINAGQSATISATYNDALSPLKWCILYVDSGVSGTMTLSAPNAKSGTASIGYTFGAAGQFKVKVGCLDIISNVYGFSAEIPVTVSAAVSNPPPADQTVSASTSNVSASPSSVAANGSSVSTVTVTVKNAGGQALSGKTVSLSSSRAASDTIIVTSGTTNSSGQAAFSVKSSTVGTSVFTATTGGITITQTATVTFMTPPPPGSCAYATGLLVKLPDDGNPNTQEDTAVYYYGKDCKRHAFPNSKIYFTWYANFNSVTVVPLTTLASMPLGKNVTYRPGVKMVKFTTVNTVYAVAKGGILRAIASEAVAISLYGATWNKQIDDINDAFYANYLFGANINAASDYNVTAELAGATTIDASL